MVAAVAADMAPVMCVERMTGSVRSVHEVSGGCEGKSKSFHQRPPPTPAGRRNRPARSRTRGGPMDGGVRSRVACGKERESSAGCDPRRVQASTTLRGWGLRGARRCRRAGHLSSQLPRRRSSRTHLITCWRASPSSKRARDDAALGGGGHVRPSVNPIDRARAQLRPRSISAD